MTRCWLIKCEPAAYTIADLERDGRTSWEGVRNYQARNFMRDDMQVGDRVLFYASNADPSGVTGLAAVVRAGYPEPRQPSPTWHMVDIAFVERFAGIVSLEALKAQRGLQKMMVTQKGSRLSVQPATRAEYDIVVRLGRHARAAT
jgi:predicted RNA-binding protein with PUA-like domain